MPDQLPIYDMTITVGNAKQFPYQRQGVPAVRMSVGVKQGDGTWLNFTDFDETRFGAYVAGNVVAIGYTQKFATNPNGSPKLDDRTGQQVIYNTIQRAELISGQWAPTPGPAPMTQQQMAPQPMQAPLPMQPQAQPGPILTATGGATDKDHAIAMAVALKAAVELNAALIASKVIKGDFDYVAKVLTDAQRINACLAAGTFEEFDAVVASAAKKLDAAIDNTPPDADDRHEPVGDEDIPF